MKTLSVRLSDVSKANGTSAISLPKYASGVINSASGFARATAPNNVGMVSQEIMDFLEDDKYPKHTLDDWKKWHLSKHENGAGIDRAVEQAWNKFKEIRKSLAKVTETDVRKWVEDLVYNKTYDGLMAQRAIIIAIANDLHTKDFKFADEVEEHHGIDGFINGKPVQIKSDTYKQTGKKHNEEMTCPVVFYRKENKKFIFKYDPKLFKKASVSSEQ